MREVREVREVLRYITLDTCIHNVAYCNCDEVLDPFGRMKIFVRKKIEFQKGDSSVNRAAIKASHSTKV